MFNRKIISYLANWKDKKQRKPLILRGARQVGKTSAILMFGKKYFKNIINLNLEKPEHLSAFKDKISLADFEKIIQIRFHQKIVAGETLIFIDEIQNSPHLIKLLRFFHEDKPNVHVIAAGSLLRVKIEQEGLSLPVGRVEYAHLYPLDFFEYLEAKEEKELLKFLQTISLAEKIPMAIHEQALKLFYEYAMVGGMPEIVKTFLERKNSNELESVYSSLLTAYTEDVYKYSSKANAKYLTYILEQAPLFAGTTIVYEKFGGGHFRSREMSQAFEILEKAMLLYRAQATKSIDLPLIAQRKRPNKLLFLDVGIVNHRMGIQREYLEMKDLNEFYRGRIAEQIVGQNILAQFTTSLPRVFYWAKEKPLASAELDFCLSNRGKIIGIEVKSGKAGRLKSLFEFAKLVNKAQLIQVYGGEFKKEKIKTNNGSFNLISLPFYLTPRILEM